MSFRRGVLEFWKEGSESLCSIEPWYFNRCPCVQRARDNPFEQNRENIGPDC